MCQRTQVALHLMDVITAELTVDLGASLGMNDIAMEE